MENTELLKLLEESATISAQIKELKTKQDELKAKVTESLDNNNLDEAIIGSFKASKVTRKGSVKTALIQAKYNISDEELNEHYRNKPSTYWTFKEIKND